MSEAKRTTDHDAIRSWAEARGGRPARVKETGGGGDPGILRIEFPEGPGDDGALEEISWEEWFDWFDRDRLELLYQDEGDSRFGKLVSRSG